MKITVLIALIIFAQVCGSEEIDFLSQIKDSSETSKALGLQKLSKEEQASLNSLLNRAYQLGAGNQLKNISPGPSNPVYVSKIDKDEGDILKLDNGSVVEITGGYVGYIGYRKDAVLYKVRKSWKIWIEGKKSYNCDIIKAPSKKSSGTGEVISVYEIKGDGKILMALGGAIFEVGDLHTIETSLWIGPLDALLINGTQMLNLGDGGGGIDVTKIR